MVNPVCEYRVSAGDFAQGDAMCKLTEPQGDAVFVTDLHSVLRSACDQVFHAEVLLQKCKRTVDTHAVFQNPDSHRIGGIEQCGRNIGRSPIAVICILRPGTAVTGAYRAVVKYGCPGKVTEFQCRRVGRERFDDRAGRVQCVCGKVEYPVPCFFADSAGDAENIARLRVNYDGGALWIFVVGCLRKMRRIRKVGFDRFLDRRIHTGFYAQSPVIYHDGRLGRCVSVGRAEIVDDVRNNHVGVPGVDTAFFTLTSV
ncbi:unknown [Clostridium sp. CAG:448]|nr:unknown [Clostridium sp. CAG:448]